MRAEPPVRGPSRSLSDRGRRSRPALSAVGNLLQNAFKFTEPQTAVNLSVYAVGDRVLINVEDHCGGLLPSEAETMFIPFTQLGENKTGLGLGLSISRRSQQGHSQRARRSRIGLRLYDRGAPLTRASRGGECGPSGRSVNLDRSSLSRPFRCRDSQTDAAGSAPTTRQRQD